MNRQRNSFQFWVNNQRARGSSHFTKTEAEKAYAGGSALAKALDRLLKSKVIAKPKAGFYIILDPPYRSAGTLPPEWYVDPLMRHLGLPYYVGAMSAAALYGGSHQAVQELQVIVPGNRKGLRPIRCGRARIRFFLKTAFKVAVLEDVKVQTGTYKASSPETTAWDLVFFQSSLGGLDQVGALLRDMEERIEPGRLARVVEAHADGLTTRRLGWILERVGAAAQAKALERFVEGKPPWRMLTAANGNHKVLDHDATWRLKVNHRLEVDE